MSSCSSLGAHRHCHAGPMYAEPHFRCDDPVSINHSAASMLCSQSECETLHKNQQSSSTNVDSLYPNSSRFFFALCLRSNICNLVSMNGSRSGRCKLMKFRLFADYFNQTIRLFLPISWSEIAELSKEMGLCAVYHMDNNGAAFWPQEMCLHVPNLTCCSLFHPTAVQKVLMCARVCVYKKDSTP